MALLLSEILMMDEKRCLHKGHAFSTRDHDSMQSLWYKCSQQSIPAVSGSCIASKQCNIYISMLHCELICSLIQYVATSATVRMFFRLRLRGVQYGYEMYVDRVRLE
eukprot:TRINITY_DN11103_c0_g1_i1.p1 TRINITY_DN11103_c0_g1~~TRINITY_DN11103_c0_g1_i1.p1  ORF type:complete len:107 (+),score=11.33 TRINITY_DN11103_c0_g1_i1:118-438(+)